jgi:hypothetical protein
VVGPDGAPLRHFSLNNRPVNDVGGAFEHPFEETGEVLLELTAPGMAPAMRTVQVREGSDVDLGEVRMGVGRRVAGRVVDSETGAPVAEVRVQISEASTTGGEPFQSEGLLKLTDEDGTFELRQVEARPLTLTVYHSDYREALIPLGAGAERVTVPLDPGARVEATLRDPQGLPLSGEVSLRSEEGNGWKTIYVREGRGLRRGIEPGLYLAQARLDDDSGSFLAQKVLIPESGLVTLDFTQRQEGATLQLRVESEAPLLDVRVLPSAMALPVTAYSLPQWRFAGLPAVKAGGRERTFQHLPPGRATLLLVTATSQRQFHLEELELPPGGVVERVVQPTWRPVPVK